jgi:phage terminase large subunit-like protein
LDLGSVSDLTALAWIFPRPEGTGYDVLWRFWTPEENIEELDKRTAGSASQWVADGWLKTTPGDVTDYDFIEQTIIEDAERFDVQTIGLDRWNGTQLANNLLDKDIPIVKVGQGMITMSPALKEIQRLVLLGKRGDPKLQHGGNPVMRWMIDNLSVAMDAAGNVKPDKATSAEKIDGVSALCDAISEALNTDLQTSAYGDDHDLIIA